MVSIPTRTSPKRCVASTYIKPKKECWLKGAIGSPMFGKGMVSGLRKLETFAPANRFETPMESKLEAFLLFHSDFAEIEKEFDQYCPFEALGSGLVKSEPEDDGGCDAYA